MHFALLGQLTRHQYIEKWWVSPAVEVPLVDARLRFVLEGIEGDPAPEELRDAVTRFLALTRADRAPATPHVFQNYRRFVEAVGEDEVELRVEHPEDVWRHVRPTEVRVSRRPLDTKVYVQVSAECDWDVEHGLQLVFRQGNVLSRVSSQDGHLAHADAYDLPEDEDRIS
jgi:hypothetical protein